MSEFFHAQPVTVHVQDHDVDAIFIQDEHDGRCCVALDDGTGCYALVARDMVTPRPIIMHPPDIHSHSLLLPKRYLSVCS